MLYCDAEGGAKGVNAPKPPLYAGEEPDVPSCFRELMPGQRTAAAMRFANHGEHVSQNTVHAFPAAELIGQLPERRHRTSRGRE